MAFPESKEITAVADSSFLIGLCLIDHFHLLTHFVQRLYLAPAVWDEVVIQGGERPGAQQVQNAAFVQIQEAKNIQAIQSLKLFLDPGESESIVLAQEIPCHILFIDDLKARRAAQEAGIHIMGIAGFLLASKMDGLVQEIRPLITTLVQKGFRLSPTVIETVLQEADEALMREE